MPIASGSANPAHRETDPLGRPHVAEETTRLLAGKTYAMRATSTGEDSGA
jgi:hypothetical protein